MPKFLKKLYKGIRIGVKIANELDKAGVVDINEAKIVDKALDELSSSKEKDGPDDLRKSGVTGAKIGPDPRRRY